MPASTSTGTRRPSMLRQVIDELAELVLPQRCLVCERFGAALHEACAEALPRAEGRRCEVCWTRLGHVGRCPRCLEAGSVLDGRRAALLFDGDTHRAILEAKFGGVSALLPPLGRVAATAVPRAWDFEVIAPVPLHPSRLRKRGFNQAEVIARAVGSALERPVEARMLRRARSTAAQAQLDAAHRAANVEGAFAVSKPGAALGRRVLVIDDVTTTGATLEAAARALRLDGARAVYALAVAIED
ncbi:MAG: ComF family protein [Dehalococcoidia bacterium]